jgi:hypothetical protein
VATVWLFSPNKVRLSEWPMMHQLISKSFIYSALTSPVNAPFFVADKF